GRYVECRDILIRYLIEVFDKGPKTVSVSRNDHSFMLPQARNDLFPPVGKDTVQGILQGFRSWIFFITQMRITMVEPWVSGILIIQRRRGDIKTPSPDMILR